MALLCNASNGLVDTGPEVCHQSSHCSTSLNPLIFLKNLDDCGSNDNTVGHLGNRPRALSIPDTEPDAGRNIRRTFHH